MAARQEAGECQPDLRVFTQYDAFGRGDDIMDWRDRAVGHEICGKYERENEGCGRGPRPLWGSLPLILAQSAGRRN